MRQRLADNRDAGSLTVLVGAFRDHLGATHPSAAQLAETLPGLLQDPTSLFALAEYDSGHAVAYSYARLYTNLWASGIEAHLEDLFVLETERGRGLGRSLLEFTTQTLRGRGALAIGLHTNENNAGAQALYRRSGFEPQTEARWQGGREVYWVRDLARGAG